MSLTSCIRKAGDALRPEDKRAIIDRAFDLRKAGAAVADAAAQAVDEQIAKVRALVETEEKAVAEAERAAAPKPVPAAPNVNSEPAQKETAPEPESFQPRLAGMPGKQGRQESVAQPGDAVQFARSTSTREAYDKRIDALFAGDAANLQGVRVLDRSDVLSMLGFADKPVLLAEGKLRAGRTNHPSMTAEVWKKVPQWLDQPAAVFDSDTVDGRLVFVAPEPVAGAPAFLVVEPDTAAGGASVHLLVNAYGKDSGAAPWGRWLSDGMLRYVDKKLFPALLADASRLQLPGTAFANKPGTKRILTEKNLAGYRRANNAAFSQGMSPELAQRIAAISRPSTVDTVRAALRELVNGIGLLPNQLGRVVVTTSSEIKSEWEPLIGAVRLDSESAGAAMAFFDPKSKTVFLIADRIPAGKEQAVVLHEMMHKHGRAVLGKDGWNRLHSVIGSWANAPEGSTERRVHDEAVERVNDSRGEADAAAHSTEELFPYAVQAAIEMGIKPNLLAKTGTVARWLGEVRKALRDVWAKVFGKAKAGQFDAQDLVNLAFGIAQRENPAHWGELDNVTRGAVPPPAVKVQVKQDGFPRFATQSVVIENPTRKQDLGVIETEDGGQLVSYSVRDPATRSLIGKVDLLVKDGKPVSLINIAMTDRRGGGGRAVVEALLAANPDTDLNVSNIVPEARGFWDRMGIPEQYQPDGDAYDGTINWRQFRDAQSERAASAPDLSGVEARELSPEETADLQFSRGPAPRFTLRVFGKAGAGIEVIQNRYNRWQHAIEDVRKQGGTISEENDFYRAEERYWGKVGGRIEDFKADVEGWVAALRKDGLSIDDVARFAYAQHAPDRNAYIASIRPGMQAGGSGMTDADAAKVIADARAAGTYDKQADHAKAMRQWIQGTRDLMLREGLITKEEHVSWTDGAMGKFYVPLRGLPEEIDVVQPTGNRTGRGFNIRGEESKRALGRASEAKQIVENIIADRTRALIRSGKNEVLRHFAKFVLDNPSPNLWEVDSVESKPTLRHDSNGDPVVEKEDSIIKDDRTVAVKDGGRTLYITVRDERLREQLQNLRDEQVGIGIGALLWTNRLMSRLYTSLSPTFTVLNFLRDVQAAGVGAIDALGFRGAAKLYANLPRAMREAGRAEIANKPSKEYFEYRMSGGKTGFLDHKTVDELSKELASLTRRLERSVADPRELFRRTFDMIESINGAVENATRFAAYVTARGEGKTVAEAASFAKNVTVNFNRRGTQRLASALYLFFNPAVQGTQRMLQALKQPKVQATLGAAMLGVFSLALRNADMGDDDDGVAWWDKIPNEVKERNLVWVLPPGTSPKIGETIPGSKVGRYIKIPMPYGYNFFAVVAMQAADRWRNSKDAARGTVSADALGRAFGAFMGSWVPVSEIGASLENKKALGLSFVPAAAKPVVQNILNVNAFGRDITPDESQHTKGLPASSQAFPGQKGTIFDRAARALNSAAGGNEITPPPGPLSLFDLSPGQLENLTRGYGGGIANFSLALLDAAYTRTMLERPELDVKRLPFAKQLYGEIDDETDRMLGYSRMEKAQESVNRYKALKKIEVEDDQKDKLEEGLRKEAGPILDLGSKITSTRRLLAQMRKEERQIVLDKTTTDAQKFKKLLELAKDRREALQSFNAAYGEGLRELRRQEESSAANPPPAPATK